LLFATISGAHLYGFGFLRVEQHAVVTEATR
jgi:hypothetical protein